MELLPPAPAGPLPEKPWQETLQTIQKVQETFQKVQGLMPEILQKMGQAPRTPSVSPPPKRLVEEPGMMPTSKKHARSTALKVETFEYA